ncbi:MAG: CDP-glycerol glycerophosphotransferase family protein, partial [Clostridia bacterium]|nr:CDP-glycerol glycerophosphotransferase family protein [Clostridia bacterium]
MKKVRMLFNRTLARDLLRCIKLFFIAFYCLFIKHKEKYKNVWLIDERWPEARDNGYWLFKYIMDNKLSGNTWFLLKPDSPDRYKLKDYSHKVLKPRSIKHYILYCMSERNISTQIGFCSPSYIYQKYFKKMTPVKKRYVYLGHGIHKDDVDFLYKKNSKIDLFITDNDIEARELIENGGYGASNVAVTGRPRNDGLHDFNIKKEILVMPTTRIWWFDPVYKANHERFRESMFFSEYQKLLDDPGLHSILDKTGCRLLFFLHTNSQAFLRHFKANHKNIELVNADDMGVQEALKNCAMLVTDYSSVAFDVSYMGKPVIYFQFDYDRFRKSQYPEGWFSYEEHGVGKIVDNRNSLIDEIGKLVDS